MGKTTTAYDGFKALADNTRLKVLRLLQGGELCACDLLKELAVGQSTLSHHMGVLTAAGLVKARRSGKWTLYSLDPAGCQNLLATATDYLSVNEASQKSNDCCKEGCV